jgi:hypothetical protein
MKNIFDKETRAEITDRINRLTSNSGAQWGKMNVHQMVKHCTLWDEWVLGVNKPVYKLGWLGYIFGRIALKNMVKNDKPIGKNLPTSRDLIIREKTGDIESQKKLWRERIFQYENFHNPGFIHDFFGRMTKEQIGILAYKHADHHLRQFAC